LNVVFKTVPRAATAVLPEGTKQGYIEFQVKVFTRGEEGSVWQNGREPASAAQWLGQVTPADTIIISPWSERHPDVPPVPLPAAVLRALPPDALVAMEFWWEPI
jgi:hypothetical protein